VNIRVSAIVVAFGADELLRTSLRALETALDNIQASTEMLVVLNGVSDNMRRELETRAASVPALRLIEPGRNLGFAGGVAAALEHARGEWIAVFNDDTVVEPDALVELLKAGASSAEVGAVAPKILFTAPGDVINSAGIEIDDLGVAYERLLGEPSAAGENQVVDVFGASGAGALYRRAMLDDVGGFDTSFFAYLEDADLAWRARADGWRALYAPQAIVHHHHSETLGHRSARKHYLVGRNRVRMLAKNASSRHLLRRWLRIILYDLSYVIYAAVRSRTLAPLRGRLRGLAEWRSYRTTRARRRRGIDLPPSRGIRGALRRDRLYDAT